MKPTIALDADGVLLDYNLAYRYAWERAFGVLPELKDALAYWPTDKWNVRELKGDELHHFRKSFDSEFWSGIPAIPGAIDACKELEGAGYHLVCVTAMDAEFTEARMTNLRDLDFPISRVISTGKLSGIKSPKADAINELRPIAFVDDYLPFFRGIEPAVHKALVLREPNGSPNSTEERSGIGSAHSDLADFAQRWLQTISKRSTASMFDRFVAEKTYCANIKID